MGRHLTRRVGEGKELMDLHDRTWLGRVARALRPIIKGFVKLLGGGEKPEPVKVRVNPARREAE